MAKRYNPNENNAAAAAALTDQGALIPPQAIELEEAVLGALMLEKDAIIEIQGVLTPEAFYKEAHQTIYKAIMDLSMELKPIDLYTVSEKLRQTRKLTSVGGASYLCLLYTSPSPRDPQADPQADLGRRRVLPGATDPEGRLGRSHRVP